MSEYQGTFKRYEKKYLVTQQQYNALAKAFAARMVPDRFAESTISNIYYDTPDFRLIRRSLDRPAYKEKLRLRTYRTPNAGTEADYTTANATLISLTDSTARASGKYTGYEIDGTDISITAAGTYVFSGDCDNGSITVKKGVTGVTIVLNGLTLTNDDSAAITLNKTAEASLIAAAGTTNTVADTANSNDESAAVKVKSGCGHAAGGRGADERGEAGQRTG